MTFVENVIIHGFMFAIFLTLYLLTMMKGTSPRIWAFSDYPKEVTESVSPQTEDEKRIATVLFIPFILISLGFPIISTLHLEVSQGGAITILEAFLNIFGIMMFGNAADLLILDTLIVGTWTPSWVIIPGTESMKDTAYKDFRKMHAKGHLWGTIGMAVISLVIALLIATF